MYVLFMEDRTTKFLIVIDGSYFEYTCLFASTRMFIEKYPEDANYWIKPVDECDQNNLPNILNCDNYKKILKQQVMWKLENIDNIAKDNFQSELNQADVIDIIFAMDDKLSNSFRKDLYPEYKAHRALVKRQYKIQPIKDYIIDVIFKELEIETHYGYHLVKVEGAEGDDVIATSLMKLNDEYCGKMLIASDHDFLQIEGMRQFDIFGKEAIRDLGGEEVSANDYLIGKILMGDKSDNIKQVFTRCGPKTALKLVKDKKMLRKMLTEDASSSSRFVLNKKIISFADIPNELSNKILECVNSTLYKNSITNHHKKIDWSQFMTL